jgi:putative membrane protein (TIGR04086 family)
MQYDPRRSSTPPSSIEPTGFFTGIRFRPIIAGIVVDTVASYALFEMYYWFFIAKDLAAQGGAAEERYAEYLSSSEGLMTTLLLGSLGTVIGGFYAGYKAGSLEMKHGALVGIGSIILGFILQSVLEAQDAFPEWFVALSAAAAIPAGALGGFFAEMFKNAIGGGRSPTSGSWSPPG